MHADVARPLKETNEKYHITETVGRTVSSGLDKATTAINNASAGGGAVAAAGDAAAAAGDAAPAPTQ